MLSINSVLTAKIKYIGKHFSEWSVKESVDDDQYIWFVTFQEPDQSYSFNDSRMGVSNKVKFVFDGTSGCSCPSAWHEGIDEKDYFDIKKTIEFDSEHAYLPEDWMEKLKESVERIYTAIKNPEKLTAKQILTEENTELRRVLIEKMGMERFVELAQPQVLDESEVGSLLKVELAGDEAIVLLAVQDASTDRKYLLRVPPDMETAKQAKAWTFGFEPHEFNPIVET